MKRKKIFPINKNKTFRPESFNCDSLDLSRPEFKEIAASGCSSVSVVSSTSGWEIQRMQHGEAEHIDLFFICSGTVHFETPDLSITASAGMVLQIVSWQERFLSLTEDGRYIYVCFDNPERYPMINDSCIHPYPAIESLDFFVRMMLNHDMTLPDEQNYLNSIANCVHILFQRELHSNYSQKHAEIMALHKLLNNPNRYGFDVSSIAKSMNMSFSKFRLFCINNFGKTPRAVIEESRMMQARRMLDFSKLSIDEIATELGYADRFVFTKAFSRYCGITPGAFRKRYFNETA